MFEGKKSEGKGERYKDGERWLSSERTLQSDWGSRTTRCATFRVSCCDKRPACNEGQSWKPVGRGASARTGHAPTGSRWRVAGAGAEEGEVLSAHARDM